MAPKKDFHPFHIHIPTTPVDLWDKFRRLAAKNRRPARAEALIVIEEKLREEGLLTPAEERKLAASRGE